jgi:hypothetical protein
MALCFKCGVDIGEAKACPLCGIPVDTMTVEPMDILGQGEDAPSTLDRRRRTLALELLSVSLGIAAISVLGIDWFGNHRLDWSLYPLVSFVFAFIFIAAPLGTPRKPLVFLTIQWIGTMIFLAVLDSIDGIMDWSLRLGIPITLTIGLSCGLVAWAATASKRRGFNIIAYALLGVVAISISVDVLIGAWIDAGKTPGWSAIVGFSLVPVACFLLYAHFRLTKNASLRKLLHL